MNELNPELEEQVDALSDLCCGALSGTESDIDAKSRPIIKALVIGGYARISDINLQTRVEAHTVNKCREHAIHRRGEIAGITGQMQDIYDELIQWHTKSPNHRSGSQAANISAITDA